MYGYFDFIYIRCSVQPLTWLPLIPAFWHLCPRVALSQIVRVGLHEMRIQQKYGIV